MSKSALGHYWIAEFTDGKVVEQFNDDETENLLQLVLDKMDTLETFSVVSSEEDELFKADLVNSKLIHNKKEYVITGSNPELIYFRRNKVRVMVGSGKITDPLVTHHLGLKTSTQEKVFEIFKGKGQRPKKIELVDNKIKKREEI